MKVWIDSDEWYPVFAIEREKVWGGSVEIEADDTTVERWERVTAEFSAIQDEMQAANQKARFLKTVE